MALLMQISDVWMDSTGRRARGKLFPVCSQVDLGQADGHRAKPLAGAVMVMMREARLADDCRM